MPIANTRFGFDGLPSHGRVRSYFAEVVQPLELVNGFQFDDIGHVSDQQGAPPILAAHTAALMPSSRPWVLISGGVHGDEPAGVYACLEFLQHKSALWQDRFQFAVLPCVNPSGFELDQLKSASGANLNRLFGTGAAQPEVRAVEDWLSNFDRTFLATFDLHEIMPGYVGEGFVESDNPPSCYLYETMHDVSRRIGRQMIEALPATTDVCLWPSIYNDRNNGGVVSYPEACGNAIYAQQTSLDAYLNGRYTDHSFTLETPTGWPMSQRVQTHLIWLDTALDQLSAWR